VRWALTAVSTAAGSLHLLVRPLDADARAETAWRTAPFRMCGRTAAAESSWCEVCVQALAGLLVYGEVVERWREQGCLGNRQDGSTEGVRTMNANKLGKALTDRARRRLYGKPTVGQPAGDVAERVRLGEDATGWPTDAEATSPFAAALRRAVRRTTP